MRMNISIPDDLREKMKAYDDEANWSAVAATAFEAEVSRRVELSSISDEVVRRLRETEIEDMGGVEEAGRRAGAEWAKRHARMAQLKRLALVHENADWSQLGPDRMAGIAMNDQSFTWDELGAVPERPDAIEIESGWLEGFVSGALEVYERASER